MKLVMIRHPVTLANIAGVIQKEVKGDIAPRGYTQIEQVTNRLRSVRFDRCYASDSDRCWELSERLGAISEISPIYSSLFREMSNGAFDGEKKDRVQRLEAKDPYNFKPEGGESINELVARAKEGLRLILSGGGDRNLLVSHGWFLKVFLGNQLGMNSLDSIRKLKFSNCALSEIDITETNCLVEYLNNRDYLT